MKHYFCNPINVNYRYQFNQNPVDGQISINREAADPSLFYFKGKYYILASMTLCAWVSENLADWSCERLPEDFPLEAYAPDGRVIGDSIYFCANESDEKGVIYRAKDLLQGPYERFECPFGFNDPCLFLDDDGRLYLYYGLSCNTPIWGVELDAKTMRPIGERKGLILGSPMEKGYERMGEDHTILPRGEEEVEQILSGYFQQSGIEADSAEAAAVSGIMRDMLSNKPYLEGAWMNKHEGKYYLQYASPATQLNVYGDSVYVSDSPLGTFMPAKDNPFSYKPGGFMPGAGHGSTMRDLQGNVWHAASMRISVNHQFERRVGIWPTGWDADGELFCNQRYGDWPQTVEDGKINPWAEPEWYLLSYGKQATASSYVEGKEPQKAVNEDARDWWQAASNAPGEWLEVDLGKSYQVHGVQINFADDKIVLADTGITKENFAPGKARYIEPRELRTRWVLEGAIEPGAYFTIEDKSKAETDLAHDFIVREEGIAVRYLRLTIFEVPYGQKACISGLRVFGRGEGKKPGKPSFDVARTNDLDMEVCISKEFYVENQKENILGYNILWGVEEDKLYHGYQVFKPMRMEEETCQGNDTKITKRIGALVKGNSYFVRVDAFNENGITVGDVKKVGNCSAQRHNEI